MEPFFGPSDVVLQICTFAEERCSGSKPTVSEVLFDLVVVWEYMSTELKLIHRPSTQQRRRLSLGT